MRRRGSQRTLAPGRRLVEFPSMKMKMLLVALALAVGAGCAAEGAAPTYGYKVVQRYPHDPGAFTQGLLFLDGALYESTGLEGQSRIRKVALENGRVLQQYSLPSQYFGEGLVNWKDRLVSITWRSEVGFVYDLKSLTVKSRFSYPGEGWGLAQDGRRLIMSDGTPQLRFLDPETLKETGRVTVTDDGQPVGNLNELEYVKGEVWANVWQTDLIARIDPGSGKVKGWIDLAGILPPVERTLGQTDVLNGIAYDAAGDRLFVTGKNWPTLFQIELEKRP
jgi:glutamine cyclotransferase